MPDYLVNSDTTDFESETFLNQFRNFGRLKKFVCFFDNTNFLMTNYYPLDDHVQAILENVNGDTMQFHHLLCGYNGHGSRRTAKLLELLGIDRETAHELCCTEKKRGLQLEIAPSSSSQNCYIIQQASSDCWFQPFEKDSQKEICSCGVSVSIVQRTMTFVRPEQNRLLDFLRSISLCRPFSFEYSMDVKKPIESDLNLRSKGLLFNDFTVSPKKSDANLLIRGDRFNVYGCIDRRAILGMSNAVYYFLTNKKLFYEYSIGGLAFLSDDFIEHPTFFSLLRLIRSKGISQKSDRIRINESHTR